MLTKKIFTNIILILISVFITLFIGEVIYRKLLFSKGDSFKNLKDPKLYANQEWDDNYWKLAQIWGISKPPNPNPLLGWGYEFWENSLIYPDMNSLNKKRPVLIYGDSFANCIDSTQCYEEYLNNDSMFSKNNFVSFVALVPG